MTALSTARPALAETMLPAAALPRILMQAGLVIAGTALIALSAKVRVPLGPVDMSLQTLAILVIAATFGLRLGMATILLYMAEGAAGLPVFQGTPEKGIGLAYMIGPTAGYLAGFVAMVAIVGWAADRGLARRPALLVAAMLVAEAVMLVLGAAWLAVLLGAEKAIAFGIGPFVATDLVKVALAAALVVATGGIADRLRSGAR